MHELAVSQELAKQQVGLRKTTSFLNTGKAALKTVVSQALEHVGEWRLCGWNKDSDQWQCACVTLEERFTLLTLGMLSLNMTIHLKYPLFSLVLWSLQEVRVHAFWQGLWSLSVIGFVSFTVFSSVCPRLQVKGQWLYSPQLQRSVGACIPAASFELWSPPLKLWWSEETKRHILDMKRMGYLLISWRLNHHASSKLAV